MPDVLGALIAIIGGMAIAATAGHFVGKGLIALGQWLKRSTSRYK
jgi:hypothetical protein